jgi:hypothetical protein
VRRKTNANSVTANTTKHIMAELRFSFANLPPGWGSLGPNRPDGN